MYACSPDWNADWMDLKSLKDILEIIAPSIKKYTRDNSIGVNKGLHFTGGEPFLNYELLLNAVKLANRLDIPATFVETNCFWCLNDEITKEKLEKLRDAGLHGILISSNPFITEFIPFERIKRCAEIAEKIFEENVIIYHPYFHSQLLSMKTSERITFEEYLNYMSLRDPLSLNITLSQALLPMGRAVYRLSNLYKKYPAKRFFGQSCLEELTRPWHVHIDNYMNYITGYCAGITVGDVRNLKQLIAEGIELEDYPILKALTTDIKQLYRYAAESGYKERKDGYVSKCHLCLDIRRFLIEKQNFRELRPKNFYRFL